MDKAKDELIKIKLAYNSYCTINEKVIINGYSPVGY